MRVEKFGFEVSRGSEAVVRDPGTTEKLLRSAILLLLFWQLLVPRNIC